MVKYDDPRQPHPTDSRLKLFLITPTICPVSYSTNSIYLDALDDQSRRRTQTVSRTSWFTSWFLIQLNIQRFTASKMATFIIRRLDNYISFLNNVQSH